ncbi:MAG: putative membrane protein [Candidatus Gottesmanbacteria bacterium GW2011_GWA1_48_13]|uniref:Putative membrane protein n=1 Tax=Candidatus Gottesmanbacteria bacterium GW2011_GWA1_48_13 TaxID=1618439 RepID=A0A0G1XMX5_9BACT|nr:MAG: putative membrane protein [Candidatus Gottesmanbacteria bacterium GW2011_GWA1_48_13]
MAVQGGLLATTIAGEDKGDGGDRESKGKIGAVLSFLAAKLIAYTLLGSLLGWLGSLIQFSLRLQATLTIFVAIFMIGTALALLNVHPVFRFFIIETPPFFRRLVRKSAKSANLFAPAILGAFTIFIPCGTTQAMMALAIASGNPLWGSLILATFVLGTSPLFFFAGYSMEWIKGVLADRFAPVAATVIIGLAVWNINGGVVLLGSPVSIQSVAREFYCTVTFCDMPVNAATRAATDVVNITIQSNGYTVDNPVIPAGRRVRIKLSNMSGGGCTQAFTIPKYGIQKVVRLGESQEFEFVAPKEPGELAFSCSMGMYGGKLFVVGG